jgi:DNA-binding MarR family transcriptional regulator
MAFTEKSIQVINYLRENANEDLVLAEVSEGTGLTKQAVTGVFNALVKKGIGYREEATVEVDGAEKVIKFLRLTDHGKTVDITSAE